jgi:hypothetical protein
MAECFKRLIVLGSLHLPSFTHDGDMTFAPTAIDGFPNLSATTTVCCTLVMKQRKLLATPALHPTTRPSRRNSPITLPPYFPITDTDEVSQTK